MFPNGEHGSLIPNQRSIGMASASDGQQAKTKKPYLQTVVFGIISLSAYLYVFSNEKLVTDVFTRGGIYAAWPIGTALFFSFIHGAFGSNLLSVLGLEAKKK
jgi:hypothetical protein